jgi:hypothetical protein
MIAQIDKQKVAVVAFAVNPARKADLGIGVGNAKCIAIM